MARTLDQILTELDSAYNPQRQSINTQISQLAPQQQAQEAGLEAQKGSAFDSIVGGARQRGLGFSGIPLGEQAQYVATNYLPALAGLKQSFNQQRTSLSDALNGINLGENQYAQQIRQSELDRDEQIRQFNEQLKAQREAQAASERAARAASGADNSWLSALGGGGGGTQQQQARGGGVDPTHQKAYNAVKQLLGTKNAALIQKTYNAIKKSAGYGNPYDKVKLQLIQQLYPASRNFGKNSVTIKRTGPTIVPWASSGGSSGGGLRVGVAQPGRLY